MRIVTEMLFKLGYERKKNYVKSGVAYENHECKKCF